MSSSLPFSNPELTPKEETLAVSRRGKRPSIGVPLESGQYEHRVALIPHSVRILVARGHRVIVERGAGKLSFYDDHEYSEAGAEITDNKEKIYSCNVIVKVAPPTSKEIAFFGQDQVLLSPLQIPNIDQKYVEELLNKKVLSVAMEYLQSEDGSFPLVRIMSELAGISAISTAADLLCNNRGGRGTLLGGISGVPPAKVVILGAGVVGEYATKAALGLGAAIRVFDDDIYKLMRIQQMVGRTLHTSSLNSAYLEYQLKSADVVIGAMHSQTARSNVVVTEEMVMKMKQGAVIVDISIDQGGCIETSEVTNHAKPTFVKHGVTHYCVPNIASKVSRTASVALSNIVTPILLEIGDSGNVEHLLYEKRGFRHGVYTYKGKLTNEYLSHRYGIKYTNLDLLMTSGL